MRVIANPYLGQVEIDENNIIRFNKGIPAFEEFTEFVILPMGDELQVFYYLQSLQEPDTCFLTCIPFTFFPDYQVCLGEDEEKAIEAANPEEIAVFALITIPEDMSQATANLLAPIVINTRTKLGLQFLPAISDYKTKHYIFPDKQKGLDAAPGKGR